MVRKKRRRPARKKKQQPKMTVDDSIFQGPITFNPDDDPMMGLDPNVTQYYQNNPILNDIQPISSKDLDKEIKTLEGGKQQYMPGYHYKTPKSKKLKPGDEVPASDNVKAPNGTQWQKKRENITHYVKDYENTDVFSDFDGYFFLEKIGNTFHCWINVSDSHPIDADGKPDSHSISGKKICERKWTDPDGKRSFALSSIAAFFGKHNILEDHQPRGYPHVYHDIDMGVGSVKYWNILDDGWSTTQPKIIAHAGETIVIDTGRMKVKKTDQTDLTKYTSFGSDFPPLYGNQINDLNFSPSVGEGCDVDIQYIPRIK